MGRADQVGYNLTDYKEVRQTRLTIQQDSSQKEKTRKTSKNQTGRRNKIGLDLQFSNKNRRWRASFCTRRPASLFSNCAMLSKIGDWPNLFKKNYFQNIYKIDISFWQNMKPKTHFSISVWALLLIRITFMIETASSLTHSSVFLTAIWSIVSNNKTQFTEESSKEISAFQHRFLHRCFG